MASKGENPMFLQRRFQPAAVSVRMNTPINSETERLTLRDVKNED
jgi:hypothetical protein